MSKIFVSFNNNQLNESEKIELFSNILNTQVLQQNGGFLFKSSVQKNDFYLGLVPTILQGERFHHYNIRLPYYDEFTFSGFINTDSSIGFLFVPPKNEALIDAEYKNKLSDSYNKTASHLISLGIPPDYPLDWKTRAIISEVSIYKKVPVYLKELL